MSIFTTLISAVELAKFCQKNWVILDCRHDLADPQAGRHAFDAGHIRGAQFVQLDDDLSGNKLGADGVFRGRHPLPEPAVFIAKLRGWGINNDTQVIAYDAHGGMFAARCWWMLRWVGHASVAVLDGGVSAWLAANQSLETGVGRPEPGTISERESLASVVDVNDVLANSQSGQLALIDARSPDRYRGENETLDKVGGHIPGAKNRFFKDNLQANGCFKSAGELQAEWREIINSPQQAIMQCGSGVTACHNLLALEVAKMHGAALYSGSWSEWCSDSTRPIAV